MVDHSDQGHFRFALNCSVCAQHWNAPAVEISSAAAAEGFVSKIYQQERELALEKAASAASGHFAPCPLCGRLACQGCIVAYHDLTMCKACLSELTERMKRRKGG